MEAHNGSAVLLWAENNKDGSAFFRFTLPIVEEGATQ
jgi:hypothetical protein